jgi:hypothetical protein
MLRKAALWVGGLGSLYAGGKIASDAYLIKQKNDVAKMQVLHTAALLARPTPLPELKYSTKVEGLILPENQRHIYDARDKLAKSELALKKHSLFRKQIGFDFATRKQEELSQKINSLRKK